MEVADAKKVYSEPDYDIAILRGHAEELEALELRGTSGLSTGQPVAAIGYPLLPSLQASATSGLLSRIHAVPQLGRGVFLETDTAVNPGNSGADRSSTSAVRSWE